MDSSLAKLVFETENGTTEVYLDEDGDVCFQDDAIIQGILAFSEASWELVVEFIDNRRRAAQ